MYQSSTTKYVLALTIVIIAAFVLVVIGYAQSEGKQALEPSYVLVDGSEIYGRVWSLDYGWIVKFDDGEAFSTCGCSSVGCSEVVEIIETLPPNETPTPPTETPPPSDTPEDKPACNRGIGNNSENCDPGNSSGQGQGQGRRAGEDRDENKPNKDK